MRKVKRTAWITVILSLFPLNKGVAVIGMPVLFILLDFLVIFLTMYALKRTPNSNVKFIMVNSLN
ncbi:hypothetical protein [Fructilactobacillus sanfranciscensis]|uniref:hypothetical protein n=1 Tax=Fructilactobacillus sanfranciscensis TaxID=1625 RepID=UPI0013D41C94|nr:hypothetical protein [Fructilactobacillus sanfranciscensis]NDR77188.1 hypothetical protein [Fructilactobacillus sanfranciscensis]